MSRARIVEVVTVQVQNGPQDAMFCEASQIVDDAWKELASSPYVQSRMGITPIRLPELTFSEAKRRSEVGRSLLRRLGRLDVSSLPHDLALTLRLVKFRAQTWSREDEWYWTVIDPLGIGSFGMFLPTAYCGALLLNFIHQQFAAFRFEGADDADRYLALLADYVRLIDQFTQRTAEQSERGLYMPKVQVHQARVLLTAFRSNSHGALGLAARRVEVPQTDGFEQEVEHRIDKYIKAAFDRALVGLSDCYLARAPAAVGVGQYPGGRELYADLVRHHTTMTLTPAQVHARGIERMAQLEASKRAIEIELGFEGDSGACLAHMNLDARWRAETAVDVASVFQRYIDRLSPRLRGLFLVEPLAPFRVEPLPDALQASMTFGYYDPPRKERAEGVYFFNARNLTTQGLFRVAALTYHELMPGHHMHLATQQENVRLHPFRMYSFVNAYNEGWAEYAASILSEEIGLYEQPEERYGRLLFDAFLTSRLVVDTGMNALGWTLERARDYMRAHSGIEEAEIISESIRYSCDIPGQSLAYKLGDTEILKLRERMTVTLGTNFDVKDFHAAVLGPGALPMADLEWHVDYETDRLIRQTAPSAR